MSKAIRSSVSRPLSVACAMFCLSGAVAAQASDSAAASAPKKAKVVVMTAAQALTVVRDPLSSVLRAPTSEEMKSLQESGVTSDTSEVRPTSIKVHQGTGARGIGLGESAFSFTVARRAADGTIFQDCVTGPQEAARTQKAPVMRTSSKVTKNTKELPRE